MKIICVLLIVIVSLVLADQTFEINGIGYWISNSVQKNWYGAFRACYQRGMYLIDFETLEEYQKVKQYLEQHPMTSQSYWTSGIAMGTKRKSEFYWAITGMTLGFNAFGPGQPDNAAGNEFCVEIQRQIGFQWNDKACREQKSFICRATRYFKLDTQISPDPIRQLL